MKTLVLCRHVETEKNLRDIHGESDLSAITGTGKREAKRLVRRIEELGLRLEGAVATPTPQAITSAKYTAELLSLPFEKILDLQPFHLGVASGVSTQRLREIDQVSFGSLDKFRNRLISASELKIADAESAASLERRLVDWWHAGGRQSCEGRLVVGSNSTVLMLAHLLNGTLPTSDHYKFLATPNGSMQVWEGTDEEQQSFTKNGFAADSWPDIRLFQHTTCHGSLAATLFAPGWDVRNTAIVIVPGYFGSSRHGPYGLYTRLARTWSYNGFSTITFDPLGSGESSPVARTFEKEVAGALALGELLLHDYQHVMFVGHSMGSAVAVAASDALKTDGSAWCLAPLCTMRDLSMNFFDEHQLSELKRDGVTLRHGLELHLHMVEAATECWTRLEKTADAVFIAVDDPYTKHQPPPKLPKCKIFSITGADHNFSQNDSMPQLSKITNDLLFDFP